MIQAEKNMKRRSSYLPISIGWVLKIAFAVAGFALWGWGFVAVVAGLYIGFKFLKRVLSCLLSLLILAVLITLLVTIISK
ncbi:hypothetical protein EZS27_031713 [termite gut metagenome]|uniref:Uncharacterized protein n=1 Tax=termite gut metagenome TaxID=433724 RepID=A0A5J4Q9C9_9ZZZZ